MSYVRLAKSTSTCRGCRTWIECFSPAVVKRGLCNPCYVQWTEELSQRDHLMRVLLGDDQDRWDRWYNDAQFHHGLSRLSLALESHLDLMLECLDVLLIEMQKRLPDVNERMRRAEEYIAQLGGMSLSPEARVMLGLPPEPSGLGNEQQQREGEQGQAD